MKRITAAMLVALTMGLWAPAASAHGYYYYDRYGVRHHVSSHRVSRNRYPRRVVVYRTYRPVIVRESPARFIPLPVPHRVPLPPPFRHF